MFIREGKHGPKPLGLAAASGQDGVAQPRQRWSRPGKALSARAGYIRPGGAFKAPASAAPEEAELRGAVSGGHWDRDQHRGASAAPREPL